MGATVNTIFAILGHAIGSRPLTFIILSLALFAVSFLGIIFRLDIRMNLKSGFTRSDAPSVTEVNAHVKFFGNLGEPWYLALFAVSRNGSLLEEDQASELTTFFKDITQEMDIVYNGEAVRYRDDLCKPFCKFNGQLWNLLEYQSLFQIRFPQSTIGPYKLNIGKFLFERTEDPTGVVTGARTIAMYFTTFINTTEKEVQLQLFEEGIMKKLYEHNNDPNNTITLVLHGAHTVSGEVKRGVKMAAPYFLIGAGLLSIFVLCSFVVCSYGFGHFHWNKLLLALGALTSPVLASLTAIGFMQLFGFHINMLVLISPFLTLAIGIGVDDAFLLSNTWMRHTIIARLENHSAAERLQLVLEKVGAAMTVTSLTNVVGFALGCLAPVPEIRLFCSAVALSMFIDLVFQLTFYAPLQVLLARFEPVEDKYEPVKVPELAKSSAFQIATCLEKFTEKYSAFLASLWAEILVVALLIAYLYSSARGIASLKTNMDGKMLIPPGSQSNEGIRIMSEVVWPDFLNINYIIRKPPNFSDPIQFQKFSRMMDAVERSPYAIGPHANMIWVRDYLRYLANPGASKLDVLFGFTGPDGNDTEAKEKGLDMSQFNMFIETEPYDAWKEGVRYKFDSLNRTIITEMLFMVGYKGTYSLADKARLLPICRKVASLYPEYEMVPFDTDAQMVDVILSVPSTTISTMLYTVAAIGAVFLIFSANCTSALVATLSVASICTGVLGMLHYCGCFLDPLTMVAVIMTAGLGVDFTVHIVFHFLMNEDAHDDNAKRIVAAFYGCGLSMIQAGISTLLVMLPVLLSPIGIYTVIAKAIVLVVLIGLVHGLFIVPVVLAALPSCLTGTACCMHCAKQ